MITTILKISKEHYETTILSIWLQWCMRHSFSIIDSQKLVCNQTLFNWWQGQYRKLEKEFLEDIKPYKELTQKDAITIYMRTVNKIHFFYSKPLLKKALKNDITTEN